MTRKTVLASAALCLALSPALAVLAAGCGSQARQYAQDARSSYITARAVLVGVAEFPAQMEALLRSGPIDAAREEAEELIDGVRDILPSASSAFRTVSEKAELLKGEDSDKFTPYAEQLLALVDVNEQIINGYMEFIGISNSVLQGIPYGDNPQELMPILNSMDAVIVRIQDLSSQLEQMEAEAETLYLEITQ